MIIAISISNNDKMRLIKEAINKIDPNSVIYEKEKDIINIFDNDCIIDEIYNNYEDKNYEITENELNEIVKKVCKLAVVFIAEIIKKYRKGQYNNGTKK